MNRPIPQIIHQTWKTHTIPEEWQACVLSWKRFHPEWEYRLWTDISGREFVAKNYHDFLSTYDSFSYNIQRADALRYLLLHTFGGVYVDLDIECLQPIYDLLAGNRIVLCQEPERHARNLGHKQLLSNAFLAAEPQHPLLSALISAMQAVNPKIIQHQEVFTTTGPILLTRVVQEHPELSPCVLDSTAFSPFDSTSRELDILKNVRPGHKKLRARCISQGGYGIHYWANTWVKNLSGQLVNPDPHQVCGYIFYPGLDSEGFDICNAGRDIQVLQAECDRNHKAVGFNTDGFLKYHIRPRQQWVKMDNPDGNEGLYIKTSQAVSSTSQLHTPDTMDIREQNNNKALKWSPLQPGDYAGHIPRILHQTWKDRNLPQDLQALKRSWNRHHPDWECWLWTDADNREFIARHFRWFLPLFDSYPHPIMRADAVRYFILWYYGGVYADLDTECLRPLDPLLADRQILLGQEPASHLNTSLARERFLNRIISNALMASVPGHPFWEHIWQHLVAWHHAQGPLDATGPFLLTRAYEAYQAHEKLHLEPPEILFPLDNEQKWADLFASEQEEIRQTAYTVHHWQGAWWKQTQRQEQEEKHKVSLLSKGELIDVSQVSTAELVRLLYRAEGHLPLVSCLMVTRERFELAKQAVYCFILQHYPSKELIIIDDGPDLRLGQWIHDLGDSRIRHIHLPDKGVCLGQLRNMALKQAQGEYLAQWDDDDLFDPGRLELQMAVLRILQTQACFLERHQLWWPDRSRMALSTRRIWESSCLCHRAVMPLYPALSKGEDTPGTQQIVRENRVALLDFPQLYIYRFHGRNTFDQVHWDQHWKAATRHYENAAYQAERASLSRRLPGILDSPEKEPSSWPRLLILIPVKNAQPFLPRLWENLTSLTYPQANISLAFVESDSTDNTYQAIARELPALRQRFDRVQLFKKDFGFTPSGSRWEPGIQQRRRSVLAKSRNYLLFRSLDEQEWVLWLDADVARIPPDLIQRLLAANKDIVVPNCLSLQTGHAYDLNSFRLQPDARHIDWSGYLVNGLLLPPAGLGRDYLADLKNEECVELDGVGGTALLIRADIHREGLIFPTFPYQGHIETEGLAVMARDMGYACYGLPSLEIYHF